MIYSNGDPMAVMAMERHRTGDYGYDSEGYDGSVHMKCPNCGSEADKIYGLTRQVDEFYAIDGKIFACNLCVERLDKYGEEIE